jgi:hypothetical protein
MEIDDYDSILQLDDSNSVFKNTFVQNDISTYGQDVTLAAAEEDSSSSNNSNPIEPALAVPSTTISGEEHHHQTFTAVNTTTTITTSEVTMTEAETAGDRSSVKHQQLAHLNMTYDKVVAGGNGNESSRVEPVDQTANQTRAVNNTTVGGGLEATLPGLVSMHSMAEPPSFLFGQDETNVSLVDNETFDFKSKQLNKTAEANKKVIFIFKKFMKNRKKSY